MGKKKKGFVNQQYSVSKQGRNIKEGTAKTRTVSWFSGTFFSISLLISVSLVAFTIFFFFSPVEGTSMRATLNAFSDDQGNNLNTDAVIVNRYKKPDYGDIIIVKYYVLDGEYTDKQGNYKLFVKRLIAKGGDTIYLEKKEASQDPLINPFGLAYKYVIERNGKEIDEWYLDCYWGRMLKCAYYDALYNYLQEPIHEGLFKNRPPSFSYFDSRGDCFIKWIEQRERYEIVLPKDYVFFMGDNRGGSGSAYDTQIMSWDCTSFGPQPQANIVGTVTDKAIDKTASQYVWYKVKQFFTFSWLKA